MSDESNVLPFPAAAKTEEVISTQERSQRLTAEVERLSRLPLVQWMLDLEKTAEQYSISQAKLRQMVNAAISRVGKEKAAREKKLRQERLARVKAFDELRRLPRAEHEAGLTTLALRLGSDVNELRDEFTVYAGLNVTEDLADVWPEPVDTHELLNDIIEQICKYAVVSDDIAIAIALWVMFAWVHEIAVHSPILVLTSPDENTGKSTVAGVMRYLVPRPHNTVELTGPSLFRTIDHLRPTLFLDENDDLFARKTDLKHIINASWTRGTKITRTIRGVAHHFELFSPKVLAMKGLKLEPTTASRAIICHMVPKLEHEEVETFRQADDEEFRTLRLRLARWSADNLDALRNAKPTMPPGFVNRLASNWRLLFAIADVGGYGRRARTAAIRLSKRGQDARSDGKRLLEALRKKFNDREMLTSAEIVETLIADEEGPWAEYRGRAPITKRQVALLLAPYGIRPVVMHPGRRSTASARGYKRRQFTEVFARFLGIEPYKRITRSKKALKNGHK